MAVLCFYVSFYNNIYTVSYTHLDVYKRQAIGTTPYTAIYEKPPPREIQDIIEFPMSQEYKFNRIRFYNKLAEDQERRQNKYQKAIKKVINYEVGEKVLLKNRELPSTFEGITKKLLLLYTGPYLINKNNNRCV